MSVDHYSCGIHCPWCKTKYNILARGLEDRGKSTEVVCTTCGAIIKATVDMSGDRVVLVRCTSVDTVKEKADHAGDCTIYASLISDNPTNGICTCGYGWKLVRQCDWSEMYSEERLGNMREQLDGIELAKRKELSIELFGIDLLDEKAD